MTWHPDGHDTVWTVPGLVPAEKPGRPQAANGTHPEYYEPKQEESKPKDGTKRRRLKAEIDKLLTELAVLGDIEYDQRREDAAKELGIRATVLDKEVRSKRRSPSGTQPRYHTGTSSHMIIRSRVPLSSMISSRSSVATSSCQRVLLMPSRYGCCMRGRWMPAISHPS